MNLEPADRPRTPMTPALRRTLLVGPALALAVVLVFHPVGEGTRMYEPLSDEVTAWLAVHIAMAPLVGLLAVATYLLLHDVPGRWATVARLALGPFVVFFVAYEAVVGVGTGVLVDHANGLPAAEQAAVADAIQAYFTNPISGDPSVFSLIGAGAWIVAMISGAVALRRAGADAAPVVLLAAASLFTAHSIPFVAAPALVCFATAAALLERSRSRQARARPVAPAVANRAVPGGGTA